MKKFLTSIIILFICISAKSQFIHQIGPRFSWQELGIHTGVVIFEYVDTFYFRHMTDSFRVDGLQFNKVRSPYVYDLENIVMTSDSGVFYAVSRDSLPYQVKGNYLLPVDTISLSNRINQKLSVEVDGSVTNEIQTLSGSGRRVILSSGGSYVIPITSYDSLTNKPTIPAQVNIIGGGINSVSGSYPNITVTGTEVDGSVTNEIELPAQTGNAGKGLVTNGTSVSWQRRPEQYQGTTNASGNYTVTFATAYSTTPNIQANLINGSDTQASRITSISTTGFTVLIRNRTDVLGLLPSYSNVVGASVHVLITEQ